MCIPMSQRDRRARTKMMIGNFALVAGMLLSMFISSLHTHNRAWLDAIMGLLFGVSICANLMAVRSRRCSSPAESQRL